MRRKLFFWELGGFLFTGALGTLLHFAYEWSGGSVLAACVSAVNESTWEHMKLLFVPLFLFSVLQACLLGRNYPDFLAVRALSTLAGLALVGWLGYSAYDKFSSNKSRDITTVNYEAVNSYLIDLTEE